ncbi:MAG TPA: hypothetical protein VGM31_14290 [Puia sp.]|jgi:hypothetical protein
MREKILAELNKKYLGLSKKVLGLVADKLTTTVTEESQIAGAIAGLDNLPITLTEFADILQKDGDARVTEALKKAKTRKEPTGDNDVDPEEEPAKGSNAALAKQIADLSKLVMGVVQNNTQKTLAEQLHAKLTEKKIPLHMAKGRVIEKAEDLDTMVADIETTFNDLKQDLANQGFTSVSTPTGGGPAEQKGGAKAAAADIESWAKAGKPPVTAGAATT